MALAAGGLLTLAWQGVRADAATPPDMLASQPPQAEERVSKKRAAPPALASLVHKGVRYTELRRGRSQGLPQNGGYIQALDEASGQALWVVRVYDSTRDPDIEQDKQDVYITRLTLDRARTGLLIDNEHGERFRLDLSSRQVTALPRR